MRPSRVGRVLAAAAAALGILLLTLAMPVRSWRTGEPAAPPLATRPGSAIGSAPVRVWLDTDAACGHGARTDPDDCLAVILLASSPGVRPCLAPIRRSRSTRFRLRVSRGSW